MRVKTTKLFRHKKRSDHKLWKRSLFEATKKRSNNLLQNVSCLNYNQAQISGTRKGFYNHGTICHKTQKQTEWWKCALIVMHQHYKHHLKTVLNTFRAAWFRQFSQKNSTFRLPYQCHSSSADCARELFSGSNGSASLVDCTRKKNFCLGGCVFLWVTS